MQTRQYQVINMWIKSLLLFFIFYTYEKDVLADVYWQQEVNTVINVQLIPNDWMLIGDVSIEYVNNSPDTLHELFIHLWPNAYKNNSTAFAKQQLQNNKIDFQFAKSWQLGYIDSLAFTANDQKLSYTAFQENIDIAHLMLQKALLPGDTLMVKTPMKVRLPAIFSRSGVSTKDFQVSQWFPKPAVYDQKGWHPMPYLDQGEFYSEFGSYEVSITLPQDYIVGATGELQDSSERAWLRNRADSCQKHVNLIDSLYQVYTESDVKTDRSILIEKMRNYSEINHRRNSDSLKTLTFRAKNVHDFAWFTSKSYWVLHDTSAVGDAIVDVWSYFHRPVTWRKSISYTKSALQFYSRKIGGYPYPQVTVVEGALQAGGGMEYPMITVIGKTTSQKELERIIVHEVGHNWWQGVLASNERDYPWIDEGINSYYENAYFKENDTSTPKLFKGIDVDFSVITNLLQAKRKLDQPIQIHSADYTAFNYGTIVYGKVPLALDYMTQNIGEENFDRSIQSFYQRYKFKHIYPKDLQEHFENIIDPYTGWFFNDNGMRNTTRKVNYTFKNIIDTVKYGNSSFYRLNIVNNGLLKSPYQLQGYLNEKLVRSMWLDGHKPKYKGTKSYPGNSGEAEILFPYGNYDKIVIDGGVLETNQKDNTVRTKGIFKKIEPLQPQLGFSLNNPNKTEFSFAPIGAWNSNNGIMGGIAFYNGLIYPAKWEYIVAPLYAFPSGVNKLNGYTKLQRNCFFNNASLLHYVSLGLSLKQFSYTKEPTDLVYQKMGTRLRVKFRPSFPTSNISKSIEWKTHFVNREYTSSSSPITSDFTKLTAEYFIQELVFHHKNTHVLHPHDIDANFQIGNSFAKLGIEAKKDWVYNELKARIQVRIFGGVFASYSSEGNLDPRFRSSGITGGQDYLFSGLYIDRGDADPRQLNISDGGLKVITSWGQSEEWLTAVNLRCHLPFTRHLELFADFATFANAQQILNSSELFLYDGGIIVSAIPEIFEIYFPFVISNDIKDELYNTGRNKWHERISFTLRLDLLDPFLFIKEKEIF